ncbi:MAG: polyprenyl diphosphate synthase [bacterium]
MVDKTKIPQHVAIIMDGNRRWAKKQGLNAVGGHNFVVDKIVEPIIERCGELGIKYLTLWAFSTENWKREESEVSGIMQLFKRALMEKMNSFIKKGARLKMIGDLSKFSPELQEGMAKAMKDSEMNDKITVTLAINYGGRDEIYRAIEKSKTSGKQLEECLDTAGMPDPDLIIRTGGEQRMSGFMMWQSAYSELYFTETLMPEFTVEKFDEAIEEFKGRQRRFGK